MHEEYEAARCEVAALLSSYRAELVEFGGDTPDGGVRFDFEIATVLLHGALWWNLSFDIEAVDLNAGPLFRASHLLNGSAAVAEVLAIALRHIQAYLDADPENLDWSYKGVPWWDSSKDEYLAQAWLASPGRALDSDDLHDRVLELTQTDLDPVRGWRLVKTMVEVATTDDQLWRIGADPLGTIVREHPEIVIAELEQLYRSDPKWRKPFKGQMSAALYQFERNVAQDGSPPSQD